MKKSKVLIVDDSPTQSFRIKIMLEELGFDVIEAHSGKTAIDIALEENPDIILSDILMPEMDGFEFCHLLRSDYGLTEIPVILQSSSYQSSEDRDFGLDIGADAFIPKGFSPEQMAKLIHQVINKKKNKKSNSSTQIGKAKQPFDELHAQRMLYKLLEETSMLEKANETIKAERNRAQKYLDVASVVMVAFDNNGVVSMINPRGSQVLGKKAEEIINQNWFDTFIPRGQAENVKEYYEKFVFNNCCEDFCIEYPVLNSHGEERLITWHNSVLPDEKGEQIGILCSGEDVTDQRIAQEKLVESEKKYHSLFTNVPGGVYRIHPNGKFLAANPGLIKMLGFQSEEEIIQINYLDVLHDDEERKKLRKILDSGGMIHDLELKLSNTSGQMVVALNNASVVRNIDGEISYYEGTLANITKNKQIEAQLAALYEKEQKRVGYLSTLQEISNELVGLKTQQEVLEVGAKRAIKLGDYAVCAIMKVDPLTKEGILTTKYGFPEDFPLRNDHRMTIPIIKQIIDSNVPKFVIREDLVAPDCIKSMFNEDIKAVHAYPIRLGDHIEAIIVLGSRIAETPPPDWAITFMDLLTQRISVALDNARLFEEINTNLSRLASLQKIDQAIANTQSMDASLSVLLDQVVAQLKVDSASVLLLNAEEDGLRFKCGKGFNKDKVYKKTLDINKCLSGKAVLEKRTIHIPDIGKKLSEFSGQSYREKSNTYSMYSSPLMIQGQVKGVIEVYIKDSFLVTKDWLEYLETMAGQAAIAVENADLFTNLQQSNNDLSFAYDETIQGWSRALDLRDKETEGHTKRVTEMTLELAETMDYKTEDLVHMRRGALLHDIGKMGIPDRILLKPGPLTDEEWVIMRMHPVFAYELILPIRYLRPALDIPYCHHERWDGSGYPRGLAGMEIPLAARIFAIVDVWDALTSDRPYRKAWSKEQALDYIQKQKGKHFDPKVVNAFVEKIGKLN